MYKIRNLIEYHDIKISKESLVVYYKYKKIKTRIYIGTLIIIIG